MWPVWLLGVLLIAVPASAEFGFDEKYQRDYNIFHPFSKLRLNNPLNLFNSIDPNSPFNRLKEIEPGNYINPFKNDRERRGRHMAGLILHPMKEIRVIVAGEHRAFVTELLDEANATGYTVFGPLSGKGHHSLHQGHYMFSEIDNFEMIMSVVPEETVQPILAGLRPFFQQYHGIMFIADVSVCRQEYFCEMSGAES